jgi:hypothetical protein
MFSFGVAQVSRMRAFRQNEDATRQLPCVARLSLLHDNLRPAMTFESEE